ncbi:asparagine synthase C-terminal domain-containing protein [Picrophilus oshimae]|uniref:Asparagine synthase (Glutamine-hydrolysing) n=1 Tax=Picrophilus torridus (strain ATCC 700027 / DSM 9790 / JCM 10055 / NBRC 100828 / KAW 2/3) TaxID=1122961 RepID=Q6L070_PICTO|nr:asparagine synthase-related protein [Picrophilus oshimae]AAT43632.1 glutamine-hydrolyzing asparagine synthase [Picrophilus oshimae DSM 9789]SMD31259.1 asparagine synthase (glutamine-hydrolysing) [Picrophilus oshimae DSM 9789]
MIEEAVYNALKEEIEKVRSKKCAISYSGGLDSTLLLYISNFSFNPYTTGYSNSRDIKNAEETSRILNFNVNKIILDNVNINSYLNDLIKIDKNIKKSEIGYELVLFITLDYISEKYVVTGQGADEIFFGYRRFIDDDNLGNEHYIKKLIEVTLPRERKIADYYNKELITPYLSDGIMDLRNDITKDKNIINGVNKMILRNIAKNIGLPEEVYLKNKKAAQYGSGISNALKKVMNK